MSTAAKEMWHQQQNDSNDGPQPMFLWLHNIEFPNISFNYSILTSDKSVNSYFKTITYGNAPKSIFSYMPLVISIFIVLFCVCLGRVI